MWIVLDDKVTKHMKYFKNQTLFVFNIESASTGALHICSSWNAIIFNSKTAISYYLNSFESAAHENLKFKYDLNRTKHIFHKFNCEIEVAFSQST